MARNTINDFSATAANNQDIAGTPILGTSPPSNFDDALRSLLAILAKMVAGTTPVDSTFAIRDTTDTTKKAQFDVSGLSASQSVKVNIDRAGAPLQTVYSTPGTYTHTFKKNSLYFRIVAVAGGGGGGGVDGQGTGTTGAASGGSSGFFGETQMRSVTAITPDGSGNYLGTVVVGSGGTGATAGNNNGSDGGMTTWNDGVNSFTWGRGRGGSGAGASSTMGALGARPLLAGSAGSIVGFSDNNTMGRIDPVPAASPADPPTKGGYGGTTPWGSGGIGGENGAAGSNGSGFGSGGGGAAVRTVTTDYAGGNGSPGRLVVYEW